MFPLNFSLENIKDLRKNGASPFTDGKPGANGEPDKKNRRSSKCGAIEKD